MKFERTCSESARCVTLRCIRSFSIAQYLRLGVRQESLSVFLGSRPRDFIDEHKEKSLSVTQRQPMYAVPVPN